MSFEKFRYDYINNYIIMIIVLALVLISVTASAFHQTSAQSIDVTIAGSNSSVTIIRDSYGVPHVFSNSLEGLFYGYGYALAQDRLYQLEILRRIATGTVSELLGPRFIDLDKTTRTQGLTLDEIRLRINMLKPEYRAILESFAMGINAYIDEALKNPDKLLPREFHALNVTPKHFTAEEIAAIFVRIIGMVFSDSSNEITNMQLLQYLINKFGEETGKAIFNDVIWMDDPAAPTSIQGGFKQSSASIDIHSSGFSQLEYLKPLLKANISSLQGLKEIENAYRSLVELGIGIPSSSNAIVVSSNRSASGSALLMGGPQFTWTVPGFLYEIGLHGAGFNVVGSTVVGLPVILFGFNDRIAWTSTAGNGNLVDIFVEKLNPNNTAQYWYNGRWVNMTKRVEMIKVAGSNPVMLEVFRTVHGPVIAIDTKNGFAFAKKRAWDGLELESLAAWIDSTRARNLKEWLDAASRFAFSIDWFYADVEGNIAYVHAGKYPVRHQGIDPRLPTPGTGEFEWAGILPFEKQPWIVDPPSGLIVGWNNKPVRGWSNGDLEPAWGSADRVNIFLRLTRDKVRISLDDLKEIVRTAAMSDVNLEYFKDYIVNAVRKLKPDDPLVISASREIESWDGLYRDGGDGYYDSAAPTIFQKWLSTMLEATFADVFGPYFSMLSYTPPRDFWPFSTNVPLGAKVLLHVLQGKNSSVPPSFDYLKGKTAEEMIVDSLRKTVNELAKEYNTSDISRWRLPILKARFELGSRFLGLVPYGNVTLPDMPYMNRGTENHFVELSFPVRGENVVPPGNSGFVSKDGKLSPHFSDQIALYVSWNYKPMRLSISDILEAAESVETLTLPDRTSELIGQALQSVNQSIGYVASRVDTLDRRISSLETTVKDLRNQSLGTSEQLRSLESSVKNLTDQLSETLDRLRSTDTGINSRVDVIQTIEYILIAIAAISIILASISLRRK